jgi:hypothetical protein
MGLGFELSFLLHKQALYCLSHISTLFCSDYSGDGFFWAICPGCHRAAILPISASWVARITSVSHLCLESLFFLLLGMESRDLCMLASALPLSYILGHLLLSRETGYPMQPRLALILHSSCLSLPSDRIIGLHHHTSQAVFFLTEKFHWVSMYKNNIIGIKCWEQHIGCSNCPIKMPPSIQVLWFTPIIPASREAEMLRIVFRGQQLGIWVGIHKTPSQSIGGCSGLHLSSQLAGKHQ